MQTLFKKSFSVIFAIFAMLQAAHASSEDALATVSKATDSVISELTKLEPEARTQDKVESLVLAYIVPAIDEQKIAMGVLGKYWRQATPDQRTQFIARFREQQIRTYTGAFKAFSGEKLVFDKAVLNPDGDKAIVKGQFQQNNGNQVPVDFRLYYNKDENKWLIYDAVISGLSMVKTYRTQLSERLQNVNMDDLLKELANEQATPQQAQR
ncbi:ABC transporter substrate-binding protein [Thalassolituus sp.]|jgi:ABC-type transporter MlaC component|uniref:MlaC/ttg2D family ABC transporter substrate-binding protein n=1 Tax=Thalassolituus sp. TaxID=2030822 RepID=UPI002A802BEB|nr:ABC transporter substrate-binding protein [Thalassolituus sp.]